MSLLDWKDIISTVATVTTVAQFLTGIQGNHVGLLGFFLQLFRIENPSFLVCQKFIKSGTTENISGTLVLMHIPFDVLARQHLKDRLCSSFFYRPFSFLPEGLPFVVGALNCGLWTKYGIYIGDGPVAFVNGVGCCLMLAYTVCYFLYTVKSKQVILQQVPMLFFFF